MKIIQINIVPTFAAVNWFEFFQLTKQKNLKIIIIYEIWVTNVDFIFILVKVIHRISYFTLKNSFYTYNFTFPRMYPTIF